MRTTGPAKDKSEFVDASHLTRVQIGFLLTMTTATDSIIFRHIFSTPESSKVWCDETRTKYYLKFEACLAIVQSRFGMIPGEAAEAIDARCKIEMIDMEELAEETKKIAIQSYLSSNK